MSLLNKYWWFSVDTIIFHHAVTSLRLYYHGQLVSMPLLLCKLQNVGGGTSVLRVTATDRDIGPNAMLFYYITAGNQDLTFRMDRVTGEMVTRPAPPDRERQQEYRLVVTVEDDGTPPLSVRLKEQKLQQVVHDKKTSQSLIMRSFSSIK